MTATLLQSMMGFLALTDEEYLKAHDTTSNISKDACEIKYGASGDGYWNNDKFLSKLLILLKLNILTH